MKFTWCYINLCYITQCYITQCCIVWCYITVLHQIKDNSLALGPGSSNGATSLCAISHILVLNPNTLDCLGQIGAINFKRVRAFSQSETGVFESDQQDRSMKFAVDQGMLSSFPSRGPMLENTLAAKIMASEIYLMRPEMSGKCDGCGGPCASQSSCMKLRTLNQKACDKKHCQACLLPLERVGGDRGVNMHPSPPGWRCCKFRYVEHVRKYLVLASRGVDIKVQLPPGFPTQGPEVAMDWALATTRNGSAPNIVAFVAALLGLV